MSMTNVSTNLAQFHFDQLTSATTNQSLRGASVTDSDRLRQAAEGFEALFLQKMMETARTSTLGDDVYSGAPSRPVGTKNPQRSRVGDRNLHSEQFGVFAPSHCVSGTKTSPRLN